MKKAILAAMALMLSFGLGYGFNSIMAKRTASEAKLKRVTSIGGIFFKCKDPKAIRAWYKTHLGLNTNDYGAVFEWHQGADSTQKGYTQWSPFRNTTKYFEPSTKDFMINFRVANLTSLVVELRKEGVVVLDTIATYNYGKFVHIMDAEDNKIELWEPNDVEYEKMGVQMGAETTK